MKLLSFASALLLAGLAAAQTCTNFQATIKAPKVVRNGKTVTFTLSAKNIGSAAATDMILAAQWSSSSTYVSSKVTNNLRIDTTSYPGAASVDIANFPKGKTFRLRVKAKIGQCAVRV